MKTHVTFTINLPVTVTVEVDAPDDMVSDYLNHGDGDDDGPMLEALACEADVVRVLSRSADVTVCDIDEAIGSDPDAFTAGLKSALKAGSK